MIAPDRIWIAPTYHSNGVDDFYLLNPKFRGNRGTEYIRADFCPTPDAVARLVEAAQAFASWDQCWPGNINLKTACRDIRAALAAMETANDQ